MKRYLRKITALWLCASTLFCFVACGGGEIPAETTENEAVTTEPETTMEETTEMEEIKKIKSYMIIWLTISPIITALCWMGAAKTFLIQVSVV